MSILGQLKGAGDLLKGMSPEQIKELMEKAKESRGMMEDLVREEVGKAVREQGLVSREEVARMIEAAK